MLVAGWLVVVDFFSKKHQRKKGYPVGGFFFFLWEVWKEQGTPGRLLFLVRFEKEGHSLIDVFFREVGEKMVSSRLLFSAKLQKKTMLT